MSSSSSPVPSNTITTSTTTTQNNEYEILSNQNRELTLRLQEKEIELQTLKESLTKEFEERERTWRSVEKTTKEAEEEKDNGGKTKMTTTTMGDSSSVTEGEGGHDGSGSTSFVSELSADSVTRYSRQLLLNDGFGVEGQKKLLSSSVLVIGAGGLASTVLLYLAAAGLSNITILDPDTVEISNLHRQIIHNSPPPPPTTSTQQQQALPPPKPKATSAAEAIQNLNPTVRCTPIIGEFTWQNALEMVKGHDVVVDASDNPKTRYLINDACVLSGIPLVSGSAMGTEGQLTLYNVKGDDTGCYRCMYPIRPKATTTADGCKSCSDNGVLGTVPGLIGILQATEVIKLVTGVGQTMEGYLVMYDALRCSFVRCKKRPRRVDCVLCGDGGEMKEGRIRTMEDSRDSLVGVRGPAPTLLQQQQQKRRPEETKDDRKGDKSMMKKDITDHISSLSSSPNNISCQEYHQLRQRGDSHVLIDVRDPRQFEMCSLEGSINVPLSKLVNGNIVEEEDGWKRVGDLSDGTKPVYCICRRGVASVKATQILMDHSSSVTMDGSSGGRQIQNDKIHSVYNIVGGYSSWAKEVDPSFPSY